MVRFDALKGLYECEKTVGCGGFAKVKLATHLATGEKVAIKILNKTTLGKDLPRIKLEVNALKSLSHRHICQLYQVIETETHYFIVLEYCSGGELFDHIVQKSRLTESESRVFFRQIVSAVAYIHSLGYAHRDLKPENVLLDDKQSLKLIDFGLCAKPDGGMKSLLFTSCGSPTYAAPELVQGKHYLGPEVDVWSMGVMLYTLICGCLPFDDTNITNLYKKILNGKYKEFEFMSEQSKNIINLMLQKDPKKRITITELLNHPWVVKNSSAVNPFSGSIKKKDEDCVTLMAQYHKVLPDEMWRHLQRWKYDYNTATYLLLLARKRRGLPLKINPEALKLSVLSKTSIPIPPRFTTKIKEESASKNKDKYEENKDKVQITPQILKSDDKIEKVSIGSDNVLCKVSESATRRFLEPQHSSGVRKPLKRIRSPNLEGECSPVPTKKLTPCKASLNTPESVKTPVKKTPGSARRMLGSIERSINRMKRALSPKNMSTSSTTTPIILFGKDLCNVSTTQCSDPELVINELVKALQAKGITCKRKGFRLRGKNEPSGKNYSGVCSFELEIGYVPALTSVSQSFPNEANTSTPAKSILKNGLFAIPNTKNETPTKVGNNNVAGASKIESFGSPMGNQRHVVGIRRKRLKGDSWCYKKVCEEILALTATDFRHGLESAV